MNPQKITIHNFTSSPGQRSATKRQTSPKGGLPPWSQGPIFFAPTTKNLKRINDVCSSQLDLAEVFVVEFPKSCLLLVVLQKYRLSVCWNLGSQRSKNQGNLISCSLKQSYTTHLGMVYTTYLWWFGGWFIIVLPTSIFVICCVYPLILDNRPVFLCSMRSEAHTKGSPGIRGLFRAIPIAEATIHQLKTFRSLARHPGIVSIGVSWVYCEICRRLSQKHMNMWQTTAIMKWSRNTDAVPHS